MSERVMDAFGIERDADEALPLLDDENGTCQWCGTSICCYFEGNGPLTCSITGRVIEP